MSSTQSKTLIALAAMLALAACSKTEAPPPAADQAAAPEESSEVLAEREAELQKREAELASREAALAEAQAASEKSVAATKPKPKPAPVASTPAPAPKPATAPPPAPLPVVLVVPAGTQLALSLASDVSTKSAKVGDSIRATLSSDVLVDGRVAIASGTTVAGQVTHVVSGSDKIGGVPTLGITFDHLELPGGKDVPISGDIRQQGKSDTARDTVKIVGGAAAGAILGHQVKGGDKGKVIGGLLGGAVGAVAAQKTGTEVKLAAGTPLSIALAAPVEIYR